MADKIVEAAEIRKTVRMLCLEANTCLGADMIEAYRRGLENEESPVGKDIFRQLIENARIGREERIPVCQDTGMVITFVEIGQDVKVVGNLSDAINTGVREAYKEGYFRKSTLDPLTRKNFGDNSPAVIHTEIVPGDSFKISVLPKGFGGEMMSRVVVFPPATGIAGVKRFIVNRVRESGANPCPPVILGVGIGGSFEKAALIAKKALLREVGERHPDAMVAELETELLEEINKLGIGPQGFGGRITALDVHVETFPTHIASIPVAVNVQCHSSRHKTAVL